MKKITLLLAIIAIALGSCTVEKRHYMSGYHVDWNTRVAKADKNKKAASSEKEYTAHSMSPKSVQGNNTIETENAGLANVSDYKFEANTAVESKVEKASKVKKQKEATRQFESITTQHSNYQDVAANVVLHTSALSMAQESSRTDQVLLVVLCFLLPPLAVYLYEGSWTERCTVNLILSLLCGIPGIIHALIVILE